MARTVTFAGTNYQIPEEGDVPYSYLTDYLIALAAAATTNSFKQGSRVATTTPQTLQASDAILYMNVASASAVTIPSSTTGTIYGVFDVSGDASTNNITITPASGNISGSATYTITGDYGGVLVQFNGTNWEVISEVFNPILRSPLQVVNDSTNASFVDAAITATAAFTSVSNLQSTSANFTGTNDIEIALALSSGEALRLLTSYASDAITAVSDLSNVFLSSDSGTGIYVSKSSSSATISFKNRMGGSRNIEIKSLTARITSPTTWS